MLENQASNIKTKELIKEIIPSSDLKTVQDELNKTNRAMQLALQFGTLFLQLQGHRSYS